MRRAFLSHSSSDKPFVDKIAHALGDLCFYDNMCFESSMPILDEIFRGMDMSDVFVFFISDKALQSPWVQREITMAQARTDDDLIRIYAVIIDPNIKATDPRIPDWLRDSVHMKNDGNPHTILRQIHNRLRTLRIRENHEGHASNLLFIGRNEEMAEFEADMTNIDMQVPTYIIAYNYITGIGRRSFLKYALRKEGRLQKVQEPLTISLSQTESIENYIYKLSTIKGNREDFDIDLSTMSMEEKISIAVGLTKDIRALGEIIFIIDDGCIIPPNRHMVGWFSKIIENEAFDNQLTFCIVSHYRPATKYHDYRGLVYNISELSPIDTQKLFLTLIELNDIRLTNTEKCEFLEVLKGVPAQVKYAVELLKSEYRYAKTHIDEIKNFSDSYQNTIIRKLRQNELAYQLLIFLSKEDVISYDIVTAVFGEGKEFYDALRILDNYSCISDMFGGSYIRLNATIRECVIRYRLKLNDQWNERYNQVRATYKNKEFDELLKEDYSAFLMELRDSVASNKPIDSKYFMPSLLLSAINTEYNKGNYKYVIKMCEQLLMHTNYDKNIVWATKYRLCMAYARRRNTVKFNATVEYFRQEGNGMDYNFLRGFFYRSINQYERALDYFNRALHINPEHLVSQREKVNALIALERYNEAVELAEYNYMRNHEDLILTHSYFTAIICDTSRRLTQAEIETLDMLMKAVESNMDHRALDVLQCMEGEYYYYVNHNLRLAVDTLKQAIDQMSNKKYAQNALRRIYHHEGMTTEMLRLQQEMNQDLNGD